MKLRKVFFFLLILFPICLFSQNIKTVGNLFIRNFKPQEYQGILGVWSMEQDKRGVMYFNNTNAILEYDGIQWKRIPVPSLLRCIEIDKNGKIFVAGVDDFGYLKTDSTGNLFFYSLLNLLPEKERKLNDIFDLIVGENNEIYFSDESKILIYQNNAIKIIYPSKNSHFLRTFKVNEKIYTSQQNIGLQILENNECKLIPEGEKFANIKIYKIVPFFQNKNTILIITQKDGFFLFDGKKVVKWNTESDEFIKTHHPYCAEFVDNQHLAIGTLRNGILIINNEGKPIRLINRESNLQDNSILSIFIDKDKNLWAGLNSGISFIELNSPFSLMEQSYGLDNITFFSTLFNNKLYTFSPTAVYTKNWTNIENPFKIEKFQRLDWVTKQILQVMISEKEMFVAHNPDFFVIDSMHKRQIISTNNMVASTFLRINEKLMMVGTVGKLFIYEKMNRKWQFRNEVKDFSHSILGILKDKYNNFWAIENLQKLIRFKMNENFDSIIEKKVYFEKKEFDLVAPDTILGNFAFGCANGFMIYDQRTDNFIPYEALNKFLPQKNTKVFLVGQKFNRIRYRLNALDGEIREFIIENDSIFPSPNHPFIRIMEKGVIGTNDIDAENLIFGCREGIIHYSRTFKKDYNQDFLTLIRKISEIHNDSSIIFSGNHCKNSDTAGFYQQETKILPYSQNSLRFFVSATFFEGQKLEFQYFLEGYDKDWSQWTSESKKDYTKISEGNYIFRVKARNIYQTVGQESIFRLKILPPWYRSIFAYIFYAFASIFLIFLIVKLNAKRLIKEKLHLEKLVSERTIEITEKNIILEQHKEELMAQAEEIQSQASSLRVINEELLVLTETLQDQKIELEYKNRQITSSIIYAQRIQNAVLPLPEMLNEYFSESFIFYRPKSIVSGDFYWFREIKRFDINNESLSSLHLIAVADCTGHGVPGAFMSMLGVSLLNEIVRRKDITQAGQVLDELRNQIKLSLRQTGKFDEAKDGMDMVFIVIDVEKMEAQFAGANHFSLLIRNNEVFELKGDKMPVGIFYKERNFSTKVIEIQKNDIFYLLTDGYEDQFGGDNKTKFSSRRLKNLLFSISHLSLSEQLTILEKTHDNWKGSNDQLDDMTILGVKI